MSETWLHQLRVYLDDDLAKVARADPHDSALRPLQDVLARHDATLVNQLRAFEDYVAEAERDGGEKTSLYHWTKASIADPAIRAKHIGAFAIRVGDQEVYAKAAADALETDLQPLVGGDIVRRMSRHDTDPAKNIPVPAAYRA